MTTWAKARAPLPLFSHVQLAHISFQSLASPYLAAFKGSIGVFDNFSGY